MILRWFSSRTVRRALDLCRRLRKLLSAQRDLLSAQAIASVESAIEELQHAIRPRESNEAIAARMAHLESSANRWLKTYPNPGMRENLDVVLVALVVAMGIRTFFLQPMAIPTGSMQPTLHGITVRNSNDDPNARIPTGARRIMDSFIRGIRYYHITAKADGQLEEIEPVTRIFKFIKKQRFKLGGEWHEIWLPPSTLPAREGVPPEQLLFAHAGIHPGHVYRKGDAVIKMKVTSGDRLFADRFTCNFRRPARGEIIIFSTQGILALQQGTHYIKRLIGLGGETVEIGADRHVVVNGQRLDASTPRFENIYSFEGPPRESEFSGHVPIASDRSTGVVVRESTVYTAPPKDYFVMGDNTMNSYDSRYWGSFPREKVIGKCAFVFWPISARFGWGVR
ncbi:MAG: signal peptidase I [Verrucomicrobia bacterium]|nr:signal peptidase I [Verrucomicrobiota bacterium]